MMAKALNTSRKTIRFLGAALGDTGRDGETVLNALVLFFVKNFRSLDAFVGKSNGPVPKICAKLGKKYTFVQG
jgi:hypothetical protein